MRHPELFFEDFPAGEIATYGDRLVERDEIVAFARAFDPQPFHVDEALAKASMIGALVASGWHTAAINHRLNCDFFLNRSACMGSPGLDELRWLRPVFPGDRLSVRRETLGGRVWRSKPDRGTVHFRYDLINQNGEVVTAHDCRVIFARRTSDAIEEEPATGGAMPPAPGSAPAVDDAASPRLDALTFFEDLPIGHVVDLGAYAFTNANIRDFALAYDNQPFHIDEDAARASHFGGIIASGWHTGAAWMASMSSSCMTATGEQDRNHSAVPAALSGASNGSAKFGMVAIVCAPRYG